jgi:uncharacterized membrane protein SirB2
MQALLSFDQAPPFAAPFRFFLTAPLFALLAGMLLLWSGPELWASRWTPAALALTHLISAGFMLQVMLGAMIQILPVVAGANIAQPLLLATLVHVALTSGALLLAAGFLTSEPLAFRLAALLLGSGVALFLGAAGHALYGVASSNPTIRGMKMALPGLGMTVGLGMLLAMALAGSLTVPLLQLTSIHLAWGFVGWSVLLLASVAFVVVPMFQITPPYPAWFTGRFAGSLLALLCLWSIAAGAGWEWPAALLADAVLLTVAALAVLTLQLQSRSKRTRFDATQHYWRLAMLCTLASCVLSLAANHLPVLAEEQEWSLLCGVLALFGGWPVGDDRHALQDRSFSGLVAPAESGRGRVLAPNMNKVIAARQIDRQMYAHFLALALAAGQRLARVVQLSGRTGAAARQCLAAAQPADRRHLLPAAATAEDRLGRCATPAGGSMSYLFLKYLHIGCVVLSGAGFLLRGLWMLADSPGCSDQGTGPASPGGHRPADQRDRPGRAQRSISLRRRLVDRQAGRSADLHRLRDDGLKRARSKAQRAVFLVAAAHCICLHRHRGLDSAAPMASWPGSLETASNTSDFCAAQVRW